MFIDRAKIHVQGGDGGNGVTAFRREKFVPRGGPSGGDGGRGGDVVLVADASLNTLLHLRYNPQHVADRGSHGEGSNRSGHSGADLLVRGVGLRFFGPVVPPTCLSAAGLAQRSWMLRQAISFKDLGATRHAYNQV